MNCEQCVKECRAEGLMCAPRDPDHIHYYEQWMYDAEAEHKRTAHAMVLTGGMYQCGKGHRAEAHPADAMRAAGQEPML